MEWNSWMENNISAVFWKVWKSSRIQTNWHISSWRIPGKWKLFFDMLCCIFIKFTHALTAFLSVSICYHLWVTVHCQADCWLCSVKESWSLPQDSGDMRHYGLSTQRQTLSYQTKPHLLVAVHPVPQLAVPFLHLLLPARGCSAHTEQLCSAHTGKLPFLYFCSPGYVVL